MIAVSWKTSAEYRHTDGTWMRPRRIPVLLASVRHLSSDIGQSAASPLAFSACGGPLESSSPRRRAESRRAERAQRQSEGRLSQREMKQSHLQQCHRARHGECTTEIRYDEYGTQKYIQKFVSI